MGLPQYRAQWRKWKEAGVVGAVEQQERAEVGLEAGVSQCMMGALSQMRDYTLSPKSKGT